MSGRAQPQALPRPLLSREMPGKGSALRVPRDGGSCYGSEYADVLSLGSAQTVFFFHGQKTQSDLQ